MFQRPQANAELDESIKRVLLEMKEKKTDSPEYAKMVDQLVKLNEIKATKAKTRLSYDTLANIGAHIGGILLILHYERVNVVGTKALTFVQKLR